MWTMKSRGRSHSERSGAALIIMVLIVVLIGALIWLDPMALMKSESTGMPWDEDHRLVRPDEQVEQPNVEQPEILEDLGFEGVIKEDLSPNIGGVNFYILTDGRVKGTWSGKYEPELNITWEVQGSRFKGNIDPSKIYSDENGEDLSKLYFIAKGHFLILETNSVTDKIKTATGAIYLTGWLDNDYVAVGKVTITSDKKTFWEYYWQAKGKKASYVPDFGSRLPGLF